jgi:hypothetical protein
MFCGTGEKLAFSPERMTSVIATAFTVRLLFSVQKLTVFTEGTAWCKELLVQRDQSIASWQ